MGERSSLQLATIHWAFLTQLHQSAYDSAEKLELVRYLHQEVDQALWPEFKNPYFMILETFRE